jgi:katanin p60 ATPase-containing subunit A1
MSSTLTALKAQNDSRLSEERRALERDRNTMVLILNHCVGKGYAQTAQRLASEAGVQLSKYEVADNMDLNSVVQEFESFYEMKFGRKPKLVRRTEGSGPGGGSSSGDEGLSKHAQARRRRAKMMGYDPR